jgi:HNH endonuclease
MISSEWYRERNQSEWKRRRKEVLQRDGYTCVYCSLVCEKFMQVNHIGAEDDDDLSNLETVCAACHSVLHLGISAMNGMLTVFECKPEVVNIAAIVCITRALVAKGIPWYEIEKQVSQRFAKLGGKYYDDQGSVNVANRMLASIGGDNFRGYLPRGLAVMFHEAGQWMQYPESIWKWQCLPGSRYRKADE